MRFEGRKWELLRKAMIVLMGGAMIWSIVASIMVGRDRGRLPPGTEMPNGQLQIIGTEPPPSGTPPPSMELTELKGKGVLLNFWATWCRPCVAEMPLLQRLHETFGGEHFVVLAATDEDHDLVRAFMARRKLGFMAVGDPAGRLARKLGVRGIPYTAFIGPDGKLIADHQGILNASKAAEMAERLVEAAQEYEP